MQGVVDQPPVQGAVAAANLDALYTFLTDTVGPLAGVTAIDTTPLLATVKRTGLIRH